MYNCAMTIPKHEKLKKAKDTPRDPKETHKKRLTELESDIKLTQMEKELEKKAKAKDLDEDEDLRRMEQDLSRNVEKMKADDIEDEDFGEGLAMDDEI